MPDTSSHGIPTSTIPSRRELGLEAVLSKEMRQIDVIQHLAKLMFDDTVTLAERRTEFRQLANLFVNNTEGTAQPKVAFLKASIDQMNLAFAHNDKGSAFKLGFKQRANAYHDLCRALVFHSESPSKPNARDTIRQIHETTESHLKPAKRQSRVELQTNRDSSATSETSRNNNNSMCGS